jgi:hypothetical protein
MLAVLDGSKAKSALIRKAAWYRNRARDEKLSFALGKYGIINVHAARGTVSSFLLRKGVV